MIAAIKNWTGAVNVNGVDYKTAQEALNSFVTPTDGTLHIKLYPKRKNTIQPILEAEERKTEYRVVVKRYMTQKSSPQFDFMAKWNNDNPMPLRTMVGEKVKETRGMVYMKLHGDIYTNKICTCMKCGRPITNPISQYFGMGPECGGHNYVNPFASEEALRQAVEHYKKELQSITWEGWIIKSAITEMEEI